mmetsp:Transcript_20382/g.68405  ORF Transcript_20382/g.68405 Transcript_20382/m.68405 type:complete len:304 (-) Transcript_20382:435-1346(-)
MAAASTRCPPTSPPSSPPAPSASATARAAARFGATCPTFPEACPGARSPRSSASWIRAPRRCPAPRRPRPRGPTPWTRPRATAGRTRAALVTRCLWRTTRAPSSGASPSSWRRPTPWWCASPTPSSGTPTGTRPPTRRCRPSRPSQAPRYTSRASRPQASSWRLPRSSRPCGRPCTPWACSRAPGTAPLRSSGRRAPSPSAHSPWPRTARRPPRPTCAPARRGTRGTRRRRSCPWRARSASPWSGAAARRPGACSPPRWPSGTCSWSASPPRAWRLAWSPQATASEHTPWAATCAGPTRPRGR